MLADNNNYKIGTNTENEIVVRISGLSERYVCWVQFSSSKKISFVAKESFAINTRLNIIQKPGIEPISSVVLVTDNIYDEKSKRFLITAVVV